MFRKHFVQQRIRTGIRRGLAAVAVASAIVLTAPAAIADEADCGLEGTEALWETVVIEPTYRTVPATSHDEWRWQREVITEIATEDEYVHQVTGAVRWERSDWGAQNGQGKGWEKTGATRAATDTVHEETDAPSAAAPEGGDWTPIEESRVSVEDSAAYDELVTPGSVEQVLVSPAVAGTEPCEEIAIISDGGPRVDDDGNVIVEAPQEPPATEETGSQAPVTQVAGPEVSAPPAAGPQATVSPAATVLPNTGGVAGWTAPVGAAAVLAGTLLARVARRRA